MSTSRKPKPKVFSTFEQAVHAASTVASQDLERRRLMGVGVKVVSDHRANEVKIQTTAFAGHGAYVRTYYATTEDTRSAYFVEDSGTAMRCPCNDCDSVPHTRHVMLLGGSSGPDTLILGYCEDGHEFGGFLQDHSGQTSGGWFIFTHMDTGLLDILMNDIEPKNSASGDTSDE